MPIIWWWYRAAFPLRTRLIGDDDRRIKFCLGPDCGKTSCTNPDLRFKQCKDCYELFGVYSYYCDAACQFEDWKRNRRHSIFHKCMLKKNGEDTPEMGYFRPENIRGAAIYMPGTDWGEGARALYISSRVPSLHRTIHTVLTDHRVCVANRAGIEKDAAGVLNELLGAPCESDVCCVWTQSTGSAIEDEDNIFGPLRECIRELLRVVYEDPEHVAHNSRSVRLREVDSVRTQLEQNAGWRAEIHFETGQPHDGITVLLVGKGDGRTRVAIKTSREWRMFRYRNPRGI